MGTNPVINLVVLRQLLKFDFYDEREACYDFLFENGVSADAMLDAIHFNTHPLDGRSRPTVMIAIGRGLEKCSAHHRVDESTIVLGFNGEIDYPDLCDVYVESAKCKITGEELTEEQLDELSDDHSLKMEMLH
jgi:hypothetical protein